ncbi:proteobacterial dedicated sortase system histidine kinase [Psychromonas sp. psych-6C06]|uniref:proteobacterial dedicated sortase system histidine kinase n=1 Tax=Psychromonas sp. psych-6C06 TaxID=2058089 RepID=UPI000C345007|nr:proteobacterial dedicated sortase system histidine kinase [Psychromonas sp. psych-6C06]PKF63629.1 proteobacterial dedicated sortase system histidine kinase [Psychromonas sp. psych-6C06]
MSIVLGLRSKVLLLTSLFLILPWLGYQAILEMQDFLRQGQQQTLIGTTRAVATALHERPALFNTQATFLNKVQAGKDLYAYALKHPIRLDGKLNDWQDEVSKSTLYDERQALFHQKKDTNNPISFRQILGTRGEYLYGFLAVQDKQPTMRSANSRFLDNNDHLIIALSSPENELQRFIVSVEKNGWFNAFRLNGEPSNNNQPVQSQREKRIQGYWQQTEIGYNIEFRLPLAMLGEKLGFALHTTSDKTVGNIESIIATANTNDLQELGTVIVPSPKIDKILQGLSHTQSRLWVVDRHQRVLATSGNIHHASGVWPNNRTTKMESDENILQVKLLTPLYNLLFSQPNSDFVDPLKGVTQLNSDFIEQALSGEPQSDSRLTVDQKTTILAAASPIFVGDKVVGVVVAEETTNGIRALRNQALSKLFNIIIAVIVVGTLLLFLFTANIATRIRKLRDQAETSIDEQGRISKTITASNSTDEIGDLSRSLTDMVKRLSEYHRYLEKLPARLSHELGTPVAVVRSSLENLALIPQDAESQKYIERSQTGILRLNRILTNMSEATRLEQSLQSGEKVPLALNDLLSNCVQGYQMTYGEHPFVFNNFSRVLNINADPDFFVQCLDKLINNALEFSNLKSPISITLSENNQFATIKIQNSGPSLPENMSEELLNSMVSVRAQHDPDKTHLGLGLFIAKMICEYHHGTININNNIANDADGNAENSGVHVMLRFPIIEHSN